MSISGELALACPDEDVRFYVGADDGGFVRMH